MIDAAHLILSLLNGFLGAAATHTGSLPPVTC